MSSFKRRNENEYNKKKVLKTVAGILIFLFLLTTIINLLGPLFRPKGQDFDGWQYFYAEDKNSLNAVMIGSSAIYRFMCLHRPMRNRDLPPV